MQSSIPRQSFESLSQITTYQAGVVQAATHRLLQQVCDDYLKQYGITKMYWLIIGTVLDKNEEGMRITELAKILQTGLPYLTTTINLLEVKGILVRDSHQQDSRSKIVRVSDDFKPKCLDIERDLRAILRETIYAQVSPEEFLIYMKVLYTIGTLAEDQEPSS